MFYWANGRRTTLQNSETGYMCTLTMKWLLLSNLSLIVKILGLGIVAFGLF